MGKLEDIEKFIYPDTIIYMDIPEDIFSIENYLYRPLFEEELNQLKKSKFPMDFKFTFNKDEN